MDPPTDPIQMLPVVEARLVDETHGSLTSPLRTVHTSPTSPLPTALMGVGLTRDLDFDVVGRLRAVGHHRSHHPSKMGNFIFR